MCGLGNPNKQSDILAHRKVFVGLLFEIIGCESRFKAGVVSVIQSNRCLLTFQFSDWLNLFFKCNVCFNMF